MPLERKVKNLKTIDDFELGSSSRDARGIKEAIWSIIEEKAICEIWACTTGREDLERYSCTIVEYRSKPMNIVHEAISFKVNGAERTIVPNDSASIIHFCPVSFKASRMSFRYHFFMKLCN